MAMVGKPLTGDTVIRTITLLIVLIAGVAVGRGLANTERVPDQRAARVTWAVGLVTKPVGLVTKPILGEGVAVTKPGLSHWHYTVRGEARPNAVTCVPTSSLPLKLSLLSTTSTSSTTAAKTTATTGIPPRRELL